MAKSSDLTNYERYLSNVKLRGYANLPIPDHEESIDELIAEGDRLLEQEAKKKTIAKSSPSTKSTSNNPYLQARLKILSAMDPETRQVIESLEKEGKKESRQYQEFIREVQRLGDKLSS